MKRAIVELILASHRTWRCARCIEGRYNVCENFGVEGLHSQYGHNTDGAYAEYVVHSIKSVFAVPDSISDEEAAMLDPTAIAMHTVIRGGQRPGDAVVVVGPGVMGLLVAECARALGAGRVIVVGRGQRLAKASESGTRPSTSPPATRPQRSAGCPAGEGPMSRSSAPGRRRRSGSASRWCARAAGWP